MYSVSYLPTFLTPSCLARRSDVAPSQSATLCARKSHPETITDRDVPLPNLPWKGLVFRFSPLVPRSRTPLLHTIAPFPRLISDHGSSFVRSVMGVPLLSRREHARERRQERNARFFFSLPSRFDFFNSSFFQSVQVFGLRAASLSMQSPLPAPSVTRARRTFGGIFLTVSSLAELIDDRSCFPVCLVERNRVESHRYKI